ncbi:MAG: DUF4129 domain-containing protein [Thermomicrobiales bacterium]
METANPATSGETLFRIAAVAAMVALIVVPIVVMGEALTPSWHGAWLAPFCIVVAVEAWWSRTRTRNMLASSSRLRFREIEAVIIVVAFQLIRGAAAGQWNPRESLLVFDPELLVAGALVALTWYMATDTASDFLDLHDPPVRGPYEAAPPPPLDRLAARFVGGGALLLLLVGIDYVVSARTDRPTGTLTAIATLDAIAYVALGVAVLGQARYTGLRGRWRREGATIASRLASRWTRDAGLLLAIAAVVALILPVGYTVGLLDLARYALGLLVALVSLLGYLLVLPIAFLFKNVSGSSTQMPFQPLTPPPPPTATAPGGGPDWGEILKSLIFWGLVLAMVVALLRTYLRSQPALRQFLAALAPAALLRRLWAALRGRLRGAADTVTERVPRPARRDRSARSVLARLPRFIRPGSLPPREQVRYYFRSTVHRATRRGLPRRAGQTPQEYAATLTPHVPHATGDLAGLTDAFTEAQYSQHDIGPQQATVARGQWERLKLALNQRDEHQAREPNSAKKTSSLPGEPGNDSAQ